MANIKINNTRKLDFKIRKDEYWDLMLSKEDGGGAGFNYDDSECLAAFVTPEIGACIEYFEKGKVFSSVSWGGAINFGDDELSGVTLYNIGFTGVDNGLVFYDKNLTDTTTFFNYYTGSFYSTCGDTRLNLSVSRCNTGEHIYPINLANDGTNKYFECKGGFLQGFFKTYGYEYQTLPDVIDNEWNMSFVIRPRSDYHVLEQTLNYEHPENKGIFFYLGTRAENKFWDVSATDEGKKKYTKDRYNMDGGYEILDSPKYDHDDCSEEFQFIEETSVYEESCPIPDSWSDDYIVDGYEPEEGTVLPGCPTEEDSMPQDYINFNPCEGENDPWVDAGYVVKPIDLDGITDIETSNGHNIFENTDNYYEIKSNNKYLLFNNTCSGYTVDKWIKEGAEEKTFIFTTKKNTKIPNYYLLFNQTCTGYTVDTIGKYLKTLEEPYDIYSDYIRNVFAMKYNDDGSLTYKYIVKDLGSGCPEYDYSTFDGDYINETTHIIEETTKPGIVKNNNWNNIHLRFEILDANGLDGCKGSGQRRMKLCIYVDGLLKFISRIIPEFNFRALQEVYDKQEGVPYNISIGGGTQGLADTVNLNFMDYTVYELPLEKYFGGTFLGDIRLFKFWTCPMDFTIINSLKKRIMG